MLQELSRYSDISITGYAPVPFTVDYPIYRLWAYLMNVIPEKRRVQ